MTPLLLPVVLAAGARCDIRQQNAKPAGRPFILCANRAQTALNGQEARPHWSGLLPCSPKLNEGFARVREGT